MCPYIRLLREGLRSRRAAPLLFTAEHRSTHICWPWDIDPWGELNNGRTLTLYDFGRVGMVLRMGILRVMRDERMVGTIAGASIRYRRRVRVFDRVELRSRIIDWDAKFLYVEQGMWRKGECTSHGLLRLAVSGREGLVAPQVVAEAMGAAISPALPDWVQAWIEAEAQRPWPPKQERPPMQEGPRMRNSPPTAPPIEAAAHTG